MKYQLAISALKQWDTPEMFEDKSLFVQISTVIGLVTSCDNWYQSLNSEQRNLLAQLSNGAIDAVIQAIDHASHNDKTLLVDTLGELIEFSTFFASQNKHH